MRVLNHAFGHPLDLEERAAMPLAGGIMQHGYQCGMIWGAALAAGAQSHRLFGSGPRAEAGAIAAAQNLVSAFRAPNSNVNCLEITGIDNTASALQMTMYFVFKGGTIDCFRMAVKYAPAAYHEIRSALSENKSAPSSPASCSAMVARKMGASDMHMIMAAGLAGGIGLSGGACGALGAAIWILGMNSLRGGAAKIDFMHPKAMDAVAKFVKCSNFEFECSKITGRKFENVNDHAVYLRSGGCSEIMKMLAAT